MARLGVCNAAVLTAFLACGSLMGCVLSGYDPLPVASREAQTEESGIVGLDAGEPDAMMRTDAGGPSTPPAAEERVAQCGETCFERCLGTDTCGAACGMGARCTTDCQGADACVGSCLAGAKCTFACRASASCSARCENGSDCTIECDAIGDCSASVCELGAKCLLRCSGDGPCEFAVCEGSLERCADGSVACGRRCDL